MKPTEKYSLIYADPSWSYDNKGTRAKAENHYSTMTLAELKRLPVWDLAADDAVLAMWWVPPMPLEAIQLAEAWGFKVKNMCLFSWHKLNKLAEQHIDKRIADMLHGPATGSIGDQLHPSGADILTLIAEQTRMGLGNYTRSNVENVLVAVKGKGLPRLQANIKQMVMAPIGEHSAKPAEIREAHEKLYGPVPRIELFSRSDAEGWDHWGNEAPSNSVELRPGVAIIPENDNYEPTEEQLRGHLLWLVLETVGEWLRPSTHIARDGLSDYLWASAPRLRDGYHWFTKAEYLALKAELQNKPSWNYAPEWARFLCQRDDGMWFWLELEPHLGVDEWKTDGKSVSAYPAGEQSQSHIIGSWLHTLERRPADLATQQAGGAA